MVGRCNVRMQTTRKADGDAQLFFCCHHPEAEAERAVMGLSAGTAGQRRVRPMGGHRESGLNMTTPAMVRHPHGAAPCSLLECWPNAVVLQSSASEARLAAASTPLILPPPPTRCNLAGDEASHCHQCLADLQPRLSVGNSRQIAATTAHTTAAATAAYDIVVAAVAAALAV